MSENDWEYMPKSARSESSFKAIYEEDEDNWWWQAYCRFDGCITLEHASNDPFPNTDPEQSDMIHICELDRFIEMLLKLKEAIKRHAVAFDIEYEGVDDDG